MILPNVIMIGAHKAGTTSLYDWLIQHPNIFGPEGMKDFPFFCDDGYFQKGEAWFNRNYFLRKNEKIILHGCVNYLYFSNIAANRIYQNNPSVKIIAVLRNPVDRAYSAYWQQKKIGHEELETFELAIQKEQARLCGEFQERANLTYIDHGFYSRQLSYYYKMFPRNNIKVMIFEEMIANKGAALKDVFEFLGVNQDFVPKFSVKNESGAARSRLVQSLLLKPIVPNFIKKMMPITFRVSAKNVLRRINTRQVVYQPLGRDMRLRLMDLYKDDISELEKMLHRDLRSVWGL